MAFLFSSSEKSTSSETRPKSRLLTILYSLPPRMRALVYILLAIFLVSAYGFLISIDTRFGTNEPIAGGSITEGVTGTLRFINPVLAFSEPDKDLTALVFSGLLKRDGQEYVPDIAESYTVSSDGKMYTFKIGDKKFHDGQAVTAQDVVFTINTIKDDRTKSPLAGSFQGVSVSAPDAKTVIFTLDRPYSPFLENATIGILPVHIWQDVKPEEMLFSSRNLNPIGSGPYRVTKVKEASSGIPEEVMLYTFPAGGKTYIPKILFKIFAGESDLVRALKERSINSAARLSGEEAKEFEGKNFEIKQAPLPRIFAVFLNQKHAPALAHSEVRKALNEAVSRKALIDEALGGYGTPISGPFELSSENDGSSTKARTTLEASGWKIGAGGIYEKTIGGKVESLSFELHTGNAPELIQGAELLKKMWADAGIAVTLKFFETGDLNQQSVRPRSFDMLFFGENIGNFPDPFAFWHSSQVSDPGLNVSGYENKEADAILEKIRVEQDASKRAEYYQTLGTLLTKDNPAIFLYAPNLLYIWSTHIGGAELAAGNAQDRFFDIGNWYVRTDRVWKFFMNNSH